MCRVFIEKESVTRLEVDCVVNAANEGLWAGGGVCGAIFREAGQQELEKACRAIGHCDTGSAVLTPGFQLNAKYIIHAVGPRWQGGHHREKELLQSCYRSALKLAADNGCKSIGFPLISAGIFGYPKAKAWEVALRTTYAFPAELTVIFAVLDDDMLKLGKAVQQRLFPSDG